MLVVHAFFGFTFMGYLKFPWIAVVIFLDYKEYLYCMEKYFLYGAT